MGQAGQNVRQLARQRRCAAVQVWAAASLLILLPLLLFAQGTLLVGWLYVLCGGLAIGLVGQGRFLWRRANHAAQGAAAEADMATVLTALVDQAWQVEYGLRHPRVGDVDVVLRSPQGRMYTIDVKSHQGQVCCEQDQLYRQYGRSRYPFEKDFLKQAKHQAVVIRGLKQVSFVTPILVFANATVAIAPGPVAGVYVVDKVHLLPCLKALG
jgi:Nuclease-related domain